MLLSGRVSVNHCRLMPDRANSRPQLKRAATCKRQHERELGAPPKRLRTSCHAVSAGETAESSVDQAAFLKLLRDKQTSEPRGKPGAVYLVGTGPGDPGLLTLRALQLMQTADVVLYDRLVSDDILQLVHGGARMVYVGKQAGYHTRTQSEIHEMLLRFAEAGASVVRLKGGDPYVFGRGGEEVAYLAAAGIKVHCVPGITAASGICAELGIPLTHRGVATSVRYLTGHTREGGEGMLHPTVAAAADPHTTLIVYMGLQSLPALAVQLRDHGMPGSMPAVAVERGTTVDQRIVFGTLESLADLAHAAGLQSPTLIVIGEVVALAAGWHEWLAAGQPLEWTERVECARLLMADGVQAPAVGMGSLGVGAAIGS